MLIPEILHKKCLAKTGCRECLKLAAFLVLKNNQIEIDRGSYNALYFNNSYSMTKRLEEIAKSCPEGAFVFSYRNTAKEQVFKG